MNEYENDLRYYCFEVCILIFHSSTLCQLGRKSEIERKRNH